MSIRIGEAPPHLPIPPPTTDQPQAVSHEPVPGAFQRMLEGLGREINEGERTIHTAETARGGRSLAPEDLLALQAGVYRYGEAVDLASKLIDHASTSVKTVINGSGQ